MNEHANAHDTTERMFGVVTDMVNAELSDMALVDYAAVTEHLSQWFATEHDAARQSMARTAKSARALARVAAVDNELRDIVDGIDDRKLKTWLLSDDVGFDHEFVDNMNAEQYERAITEYHDAHDPDDETAAL